VRPPELRRRRPQPHTPPVQRLRECRVPVTTQHPPAVDRLTTTGGHRGDRLVDVAATGQRIVVDQRDVHPHTSRDARFDCEVFVDAARMENVSRHQQQHGHMVPGHATRPPAFMPPHDSQRLPCT
jgi:hypothetical protein